MTTAPESPRAAAGRSLIAADVAITGDIGSEGTVEIAGIDHVGIGTDFSHNHTPADYDWMRKGRWTRSVQYGAGSAKNPGPAPKLDWLKSIDRLGTIADALRQTGFKQDEVARLMGGNWLRLYRDVLG